MADAIFGNQICVVWHAGIRDKTNAAMFGVGKQSAMGRSQKTRAAASEDPGHSEIGGMSILSFISRHPSRSRPAGIARFDFLAMIFDKFAAELDAEKENLVNRYRSSVTNAAFLDEAIENRSVSPDRSLQLSRLTNLILSYERRIAMLSRQTDAMAEFRAAMHNLRDEATARRNV
jgi:hypothetical protein